jgi:predicted O-methyltransferase YrrM
MRGDNSFRRAKDSFLETLHASPHLTGPIYRLRYGRLGPYLAHARSIPGWLTRNEGLLLGQLALAAPSDAVMVEIGSFLGRSAVVIAGALKERGNGILHCVDPFDASGDSFSAPIYKAISEEHGSSLRQEFERNVARAGVDQWIRIRQGTAVAAAEGWHTPIDLLFMDGDQSPEGVRSAYERWGPFLKVGGVIGLHNSSERTYAAGHDGHRLLAHELAASPASINFVSVDSTTWWRRLP